MDAELSAECAHDRENLCGEFCRGCGYCMPCPAGIEINNCARMGLLLRRSPSAEHLSPAGQARMKKIEGCLHCNQYETRCPYGLDTPALLARNYEDYKQVLAGKSRCNRENKKMDAARHPSFCFTAKRGSAPGRSSWPACSSG